MHFVHFTYVESTLFSTLPLLKTSNNYFHISYSRLKFCRNLFASTFVIKNRMTLANKVIYLFDHERCSAKDIYLGAM